MIELWELKGRNDRRYSLFSVFQWARITCPQDVLAAGVPLHAWRESMLGLHAGFARNVIAA